MVTVPDAQERKRYWTKLCKEEEMSRFSTTRHKEIERYRHLNQATAVLNGFELILQYNQRANLESRPLA
ncbi:uncharacterized protein G2W53_034085 [Senna tora]|uniref:Uncharacterized protein n=1 Tax=Senna tora TaxID=362788 RepID=A0A834WDG4_9FABA|nr:uncharacterized protein G2W53_034085 [Senna tora]